MSRTEDIIATVRDNLGDKEGDRFSDASLLRWLNEGMRDISKKTEIFKTSALIPLEIGVHTYEMPEDFIKAKEFTFGQEPLEIESESTMTQLYSKRWRMASTESKITTVITDRQDSRQVRVYPRPFIQGLYTEYTLDSEFGVTSDIEGYDISEYGVLDALVDPELIDEEPSPYGIFVGAVEGTYLGVEYVRRSTPITTLEEEPELPDVFDSALVRYVAGSALRSDINAQNRSMGNEELTLYLSEVDDIQSVSQNVQTSTATNSSVRYNGMG